MSSKISSAFSEWLSKLLPLSTINIIDDRINIQFKKPNHIASNIVKMDLGGMWDIKKNILQIQQKIGVFKKDNFTSLYKSSKLFMPHLTELEFSKTNDGKWNDNIVTIRPCSLLDTIKPSCITVLFREITIETGYSEIILNIDVKNLIAYMDDLIIIINKNDAML